MKITVWSIHYAPEQTGVGPYSAALCEHLREQGHEVHTVTSFAHYPNWHKARLDRGALYRTDDLNGVTVHRCWTYVPRRATALGRLLHEATFLLTSWLRQLALPRSDVLLVVSPPLLLGAAAWALGRIKRMPFVLHMQELRPAAAGMAVFKHVGLSSLLQRLERFAIQKAALVSGASPGMLAAFAAYGVDATRRCCAPHAVVPALPTPLPAPGRFRQRLEVDSTHLLAVYSGTIGASHGLEGVFEAARRITHPKVLLVICGEGSHRAHLLKLLHRHQLSNVVMLRLQPEDRYYELLLDADICLIPQHHDFGNCRLPRKLLNALACARPALTIAHESSELVRTLRQGQFGMNVPPGQPDTLAKTLQHLADHPALLQQYGQAAHRYAEQFGLNTMMDQFGESLSRVAAGLPLQQAVGDGGQHFVLSPQAQRHKAA